MKGIELLNKDPVDGCIVMIPDEHVDIFYNEDGEFDWINNTDIEDPDTGTNNNLIFSEDNSRNIGLDQLARYYNTSFEVFFENGERLFFDRDCIKHNIKPGYYYAGTINNISYKGDGKQYEWTIDRIGDLLEGNLEDSTNYNTTEKASDIKCNKDRWYIIDGNLYIKSDIEIPNKANGFEPIHKNNLIPNLCKKIAKEHMMCMYCHYNRVDRCLTIASKFWEAVRLTSDCIWTNDFIGIEKTTNAGIFELISD